MKSFILRYAPKWELIDIIMIANTLRDGTYLA